MNDVPQDPWLLKKLADRLDLTWGVWTRSDITRSDEIAAIAEELRSIATEIPSDGNPQRGEWWSAGTAQTALAAYESRCRTEMKLILEVLQFLLTREISRLKGDWKTEVKNLMAANHLLGRVEHRGTAHFAGPSQKGKQE